MLKNLGRYWANGNPPKIVAGKIFTIAIFRLRNGYNITVSESIRHIFFKCSLGFDERGFRIVSDTLVTNETRTAHAHTLETLSSIITVTLSHQLAA